VDARASLPDSLRRQLPGWLREIPLYRQRQPFPPSAELASEFFRLPLITKRDIRTGFPQNFLRDGVELDDLLESDAVELEHTAGTSEERTPLILGRQWWAEQESRALRLNPFVAGVLDEFPDARRVTINSPMCSGDIRYSGTVTRSDRIVGHTLFTSLSRLPFLWGEADLARMVAEAVEWNPVFLDVDPVYGALFALECERRGIRFPSLQFVLASYEFVSAAHRRILERAFNVPVFNLYGSTETGHLLMETEPGRLRASAETAYLELLNCDETRIGDLVVTTLTNDFMPLIRYRIGDLVEPEPGGDYIVHGRAADAFALPGGGRATTLQVDHVISPTPGVAHYQIHELPGREFLLRYFPDRTPPSETALAELKRRLESLLDCPERCRLEATDTLMPEKSGKFRLGYPLKSAPS
jgi:phenylacetate-CoA ligase